MIVLGISGFEDESGDSRRQAHAPDSHGIRGLDFLDDGVPIQYFPLGLIGHDAAAAIVVDGTLVASAAEERFSRIKHGLNLAGRTLLPRNAVRYCLEEAGCSWADVDVVAHYCRFTPAAIEARLHRVGSRLTPELLERLQEEYSTAYRRRLAPDLVRSQLEKMAGIPIPDHRFVAVPHHLAHAAGAYESSGFGEALCVTIDGYGEEDSAGWAIASDGRLVPQGRVLLPNSLGALYQAVTLFLGFRSFGDEYKTMGLAAYGNPERYEQVFAELVEVGDEGKWSTEAVSRPDLGKWLESRLGPTRHPGAYTDRNADVAASLQGSLEHAVLNMLGALKERYGQECLCLAGGVALNAVMNGSIVRSGLFRRVFVQPAASDDGAALGAALHATAQLDGNAIRGSIHHTSWGPGYSDPDIENALGSLDGVSWSRVSDVEARTAALLAEEKVVGWFQGRMELGPRALGCRSILASPRSAETRDRINEMVKHRESFRPFGPSVLAEEARRYFDIPDDTAAAYMIVTYRTREEQRERIPAVVHVDGSARVQIVHRDTSPKYHRLLCDFRDLTGVPVLLNTSFNRAGEPLVCSPEDAVSCFVRSGLDALAIGDYIAIRSGSTRPVQ